MSHNFEIICSHYFYTTLYFVRRLQIKFDKLKSHERTPGVGEWQYRREHFITKGLELILNIDFYLCELINKIGIRLPGLSLLAVAKKRI